MKKTGKRRLIIGVIVVVCIVALALGLGLGLGLKEDEENTTTTTLSSTTAGQISQDQLSRIDCYPELRSSLSFEEAKAACEARGCKYDPEVPDKVPHCYISPDSRLGAGYSAEISYQNESGILVRLTSRVPDMNRVVSHSTFRAIEPSASATLYVEYYGENVLRVKLTPEDVGQKTRYEVPDEILHRNLPSQTISHSRKYDVRITNTTKLAFQVIRKSTGTIIWDTSVGGTILADQFLSISTRLASHNIYGFGENVHTTFRHDLNFRTWGLFARDQVVGHEETNHYSVHPFYTSVEDDGHSHGVLLLNSNAMDYSFTSLPMLTYRTIGGVLDFYFFFGPTPENVIQQYTEFIGRPFMPPYWSLGFQLCRYGYNSLENLKAAVNRTQAIGVPQDVQYADIDHFDERKVFTIDNVSFAGLPDYFRELQANGMHTIIILDPFIITNASNYAPFELGLQRDVFVHWPNRTVMSDEDFLVTNSTSMLGFVWPKGKVVFPDFFLNRTDELWQELIVNHHSVLPFDGLWIDMNEPANFGTNEERPWNWPEDDRPYWSLKCPEGPLDDPEYRTKAAFYYDEEARRNNRQWARLSDKTLCMIAVQGEQKQYRHYDVHSLYGASQILPTLKGLRRATPQKRGIVLGRSTFPGSGKYIGHWLGDNFSEWPSMAESIIGMLEFNLFGIPYIGADICGFLGDVTPELCMRWTQLGAFYPYSRNHNQADSKVEQDPGSFDEPIQRLSREAMLTRYSLLPYLYTLFHHAHISGNTVVRPLFHEFPMDSGTYNIDRQFLWGPALMIVPILEQNQSTLHFYQPAGRWYNYYTNESLDSSSGVQNSLSVTNESAIPLFVRGGYILVTQEPANNTHFSRKNPFHATVYLDALDTSGGQATGDLFWDDGDSIDTHENRHYFYAHLNCSQRRFIFDIQFNGIPEKMKQVYLSSVSVLGVLKSGRSFNVTVNGESWKNFSYNSSTQMLVIHSLNWQMNNGTVIEWQDQGPSDDELLRIDCAPEGVIETQCLAKGCLWSYSDFPGIPFCYLNSASYGYRSVKVSSNETVDHIELERIDSHSSMFGDDEQQIAIDVTFVNDWLLRIKVYALPMDSIYQVPVALNLPSGGSKDTALYSVTYSNTSIFSLSVIRRETGTVVWDTSIGGLTVAKQFLQFAVRVPSTRLYGFGESVRDTFQRSFDYVTIPMFSRDQPPYVNGNLYGVHPYYLMVEDKEGYSHGVLLLNSNAMEVHLQPTPAVIYRTTGGLLDFYLVFDKNPERVTSRYTELIGRPYFPPYWSLGFQLSRYGYNSLENLKAAVNRTLSADIPLDVQYADIDHMNNSQDFTYDRDKYAGLPQYVTQLQDLGMHFIIILDPALVGVDDSYKPFVDGRNADVFIHWPENFDHPDISRFNSTFMYGYVWPNGETVFPDFFNPRTQEWWKQCITEHHLEIPFDGLWIDMNEPANFGTNDEKPFNWPANKTAWSLKCNVTSLDDPPYKPRSIWGPRLSDKTICMVGVQTDGVKNFSHYDVHNLYGWSQTLPTLRAVQEVTKQRSIVISRSTYVGSGQYCGHWLGDNASEWPQLHQSIIGMLDFSLFGIPYIGADICGYFNNATSELCLRWMQLGAFYTFSRNHNGLNYIDQDPAAYGDFVANSSRAVLRIRYSFLPYLYTLFYEAHVYGHTVIRPLFHEFYNDSITYEIDRQFLWGPALLISPVLEQGNTTVEAYLPHSRWFDVYSGKEEPLTGQHVIFNAPLEKIPLHLRGGNIIPTQAPALNTNHSRLNNFSLIVCLDSNQHAVGKLFWDDGVEIDSIEKGNYTLIHYTLNETTVGTFNLSSSVIHHFAGITIPPIETIMVHGIANKPAEAAIIQNGTTTDITSSLVYNTESQVLHLNNLDLAVSGEWTVSWW